VRGGVPWSQGVNGTSELVVREVEFERGVLEKCVWNSPSELIVRESEIIEFMKLREGGGDGASELVPREMESVE
jgi:hypothetical protein